MSDIQFNETDGRGRWSISFDDADDAEMTFSRSSDTLVMLDHTFVPEEKRGEDHAKALAERAVADAREHGWKIIPVCPFFKAIAARHDNWNDVVKS